MIKKLLVILIILIVIFLAFFVYKNLSTEKEFVDFNESDSAIYVEPEFNRTLLSFEEISKEEYESKKEKYYEKKYIKPSTSLPKDVYRENGCLIFKEKDGSISRLSLCDYLPKENEPETRIKIYDNPVYLPEIDAYFVSERLYEGGKYYLVDREFPTSIQEINHHPVFNQKNNFFFTFINTETTYASKYGLSIWSFNKENEYEKIKEIVHYDQSFFGTDIGEAFWVEDEIYLRTIYMTSYQGYLKIKFNEFPKDLPRG